MTVPVIWLLCARLLLMLSIFNHYTKLVFMPSILSPDCGVTLQSRQNTNLLNKTLFLLILNRVNAFLILLFIIFVLVLQNLASDYFFKYVYNIRALEIILSELYFTGNNTKTCNKFIHLKQEHQQKLSALI